MTEQDTAFTPSHLDWLLQNFVSATPGVRAASFNARDGLPMACTLTNRTDSEYWAALAGSQLSTAERLAALGGDAQPASQVVTQLADGSMLVTMSAGEGLPPWASAQASTAEQATGCVLCVRTDADADPGVVIYEMRMFIASVAEHLTVPVRQAA